MKILFSDEENEIFTKITDVYNSGEYEQAYELAHNFLIKFPNSIKAKYKLAVMAGDSSEQGILSDDIKTQRMAMAKEMINDLFQSYEQVDLPDLLNYRIRNEYYWFFKEHKNQFDLGLEMLSIDLPGHYSCCVGASMQSTKLIDQKDEAKSWAILSIEHFDRFVEINPTWHNINLFAAKAYAVLGNKKKAIEIYDDMFLKQGKNVNLSEKQLFLAEMEYLIT